MILLAPSVVLWLRGLMWLHSRGNTQLEWGGYIADITAQMFMFTLRLEVQTVVHTLPREAAILHDYKV